jgi:hypothetical protein
MQRFQAKVLVIELLLETEQLVMYLSKMSCEFSRFFSIETKVKQLIINQIEMKKI